LNTMQLDLFMDGRDVMLQNDVIAALRARDAIAGRRALAAFETEYPAHEAVTLLRLLLDTLEKPLAPITSHSNAADALSVMQAKVVPAAQRIFGSNAAADWLSPLWLSLADAAAGLPFNAQMPQHHRAYLLLQSGKWATAGGEIARIPSWRRIPAPLAWMAQARFHQGGLESAWCLLMELAWIDAHAFNRLADQLPAPALHKHLKDFDAALDDDEPDRAWFPAWLLIALPALSSVMRDTQPGSNHAPERVARLIVDLLALEKQGRHADIVTLRKKLRDGHAGLFAFYMQTR
jgi:hypothetical protein